MWGTLMLMFFFFWFLDLVLDSLRKRRLLEEEVSLYKHLLVVRWLKMGVCPACSEVLHGREECWWRMFVGRTNTVTALNCNKVEAECWHMCMCRPMQFTTAMIHRRRRSCQCDFAWNISSHLVWTLAVLYGTLVIVWNISSNRLVIRGCWISHCMQWRRWASDTYVYIILALKIQAIAFKSFEEEDAWRRGCKDHLHCMHEEARRSCKEHLQCMDMDAMQLV